MDKKVISWEFVKECSRELKKNFKGIEAFTHGSCCNTCYYDEWENSKKNDNDFVDAKIFKGGLNNQFHYGKYELYNILYYNWKLTDFKLGDVINVMQKVADKYGYKIITPENEDCCIEVRVD